MLFPEISGTFSRSTATSAYWWKEIPLSARLSESTTADGKPRQQHVKAGNIAEHLLTDDVVFELTFSHLSQDDVIIKLNINNILFTFNSLFKLM